MVPGALEPKLAECRFARVAQPASAGLEMPSPRPLRERAAGEPRRLHIRRMRASAVSLAVSLVVGPLLARKLR